MVEVIADNTGFKNGIRAILPKVLLPSGTRAYIGLTSLTAFRKSAAKGSKWNQFGIENAIRLQSRQETVRKAINSIGPWSYKLVSANCEHFATSMCTSHAGQSSQIEQTVPAWLIGAVRGNTETEVPLWTVTDIAEPRQHQRTHDGTLQTTCNGVITLRCRNQLNPSEFQDNFYSIEELYNNLTLSGIQNKSASYSTVCGQLSDSQVKRVIDAHKAWRGCQLLQ